MKISPINNTLNVNKNSKQSFSGLWGKTTFRTDFDPVLSVPKIETIYYYYPFKNESSSKIDKIVDDNSSADIVDGSKYVVKECKQCYTLPFDESAYESYLQAGLNTELTASLRQIHANVYDKYTSNDYAETQKSAANPEISRRLVDRRF